MKILVIYYSRTGTTKKVAEAIANKLGAEIEEIKDTVSRSGLKGFLISGRDGIKKRLTKIEPSKLNVADFELAIIGTPIWSGNMSAPIRTYLTEQKDKFNQVAFFCTMGSGGDKKAFSEMEEIVGKKPMATISILTKDVVKENYLDKLNNFLKELNIV